MTATAVRAISARATPVRDTSMGPRGEGAPVSAKPVGAAP
jgi:hypothetical protein